MSPRFFRHRELHLVVLALLAGRSMHGYELMGELADRFGPSYRPSAGSVYPALDALAREHLIEPDIGSEPTEYRLTPDGEETLAQRAATLLKIEQRTGVTLGAEPQVEAALIQVNQAARTAAGHGLGDAVSRLLIETTRQLTALNEEVP